MHISVFSMSPLIAYSFSPTAQILKSLRLELLFWVLTVSSLVILKFKDSDLISIEWGSGICILAAAMKWELRQRSAKPPTLLPRPPPQAPFSFHSCPPDLAQAPLMGKIYQALFKGETECCPTLTTDSLTHANTCACTHAHPPPPYPVSGDMASLPPMHRWPLIIRRLQN